MERIRGSYTPGKGQSFKIGFAVIKAREPDFDFLLKIEKKQPKSCIIRSFGGADASEERPGLPGWNASVRDTYRRAQ
jgi:hypothetical protein